jgi:hypothetical protein
MGNLLKISYFLQFYDKIVRRYFIRIPWVRTKINQAQLLFSCPFFESIQGRNHQFF